MSHDVINLYLRSYLDLSGISPFFFFLDVVSIEGSLIRGSLSLSALESLYWLNVKVVDSGGGA